MLGFPYERHSYIVTPQPATSFDPRHWRNPLAFDPDRYRSVPTSDQIDEAKCQQIGLAKCPFDLTSFEVADGRKASIRNSGFGTVFSVVDDRPLPVCDYAGFAPFGFGYRRCPGELLTVEVFSDFLRKVWNDKIEFSKLGLPNPERRPGPGSSSVVEDDMSFLRASEAGPFRKIHDGCMRASHGAHQGLVLRPEKKHCQWFERERQMNKRKRSVFWPWHVRCLDWLRRLAPWPNSNT